MKWFSIIQISFDLLSVIIEIFEKDIAEINLLLQFFVLRQRQRFLWKLLRQLGDLSRTEGELITSLFLVPLKYFNNSAQYHEVVCCA